MVLENPTNYPKKIQQVEKIRFSFFLRDRKHFLGDSLETCQLYFTLVALGLEGKRLPIKLINREVTISNVIEIKKTEAKGWCSDAEANLLLLNNSTYFRILATSTNQYQIYIYNNLEDLNSGRFYGTGLFYITVMYTHFTQTKISKKSHRIEKNGETEFFSKYNFTDVTSIVLESNDSATRTSYMVTVCDKVITFYKS